MNETSTFSWWKVLFFWCFMASVIAQNTTTSQEANLRGYFLKKVVSNSTTPTGVDFTYTIFYTIPAGSPATTITDLVPSSLVVDNVIATAVCGIPTVSQSAVVGGTQVNYTVPATVSACSGSFQINVKFPTGTTCNGATAQNRACLRTSTGADLCTGYVSTTAQATDPWKVDKVPTGLSYTGGTCQWATTSDTVEYIVSVYKTTGLYGFLNLENATIVDRIPAGAVFISGTPIAPATGTITASGTNITWTGLGTLDATQNYFQRQAKIKVYYPGFATNTSRTNKTILTGTLGKATSPLCGLHADSLQICVTKSAPVTSGQITKYAYVSGNAVGCAGYYTIVVCNNGTTPLTSFNVYDNIPMGITVTSIQVTGTATNPVTINVNSSNVLVNATSTQTYTATLGATPSIYFQNNGTLAVGACVSYRINFTINSMASNSILNCASLRYPMPNPTTVRNSCNSIGIYPPTTNVCAYKEICNKQTTYNQGQVLRYRLRVQNIGTVTLTGAYINDLLNSNLQYIGNETYYTSSNYSPVCTSGSGIPAGTTAWSGVTTSHSGGNLRWNIPTIGTSCSNIYYPNCGQYGTSGVPFYFIEFDVKVLNNAAVGIIPNFFRVHSNLSAALTTSNTEYLTINAVFGFTLDKKISKDNGSTFANSVVTSPNTNVIYRLGLTKTGAALKNLLFFDMLPRNNVATDFLMLNSTVSRGSQFDVLHQNFVSTTPLNATSSYANSVNICLPDLSYSPSGCNATTTWTAPALNARNVKASFGSSFMSTATQQYSFRGLVSASAQNSQQACNTFAARAAALMYINNANTDVNLTPNESNSACVFIDGAAVNCCEKTQILQTDKLCCSKLKVACPVKQIKVTLTNGTFTNLAWTCNPALTNYVGSSSYTFIPTGTCDSTTVDACFKATSNDNVTITYNITFANGTTCTKTESKKCCCTPTVTVPKTACLGLPVSFRFVTSDCPVQNISWNFGNGFTSTSLNPTTAYTTVGTYTITLTYENGCGKQTQTYQVIVTKCVCSITPCISYAATDLQVLFNSTGSTSTYPISAYHWDFGDGNWSSSATYTHTYLNAGTYNVCLTVYADNGSGPCECVAKVCRTIVVTPGMGTAGNCAQMLPPKPLSEPTESASRKAALEVEHASEEEKEPKPSLLRVMPNPFENVMKVTLDNLLKSKILTDKTQLELHTIQGKLVKTVTLTGTFNEVEVSTHELPAGTYLLSYKRNGKVESSVKVVKE